MPDPAPSIVHAIENCPGLAVGDAGLVWFDSLGRQHLLSRCVRVSVGEAAKRLGRSEATILRRIRAIELYPVLRHSPRDIEVYEVAIDDLIHRATVNSKEENPAGTP